jgi:hypothetical protein
MDQRIGKLAFIILSQGHERLAEGKHPPAPQSPNPPGEALQDQVRQPRLGRDALLEEVAVHQEPRLQDPFNSAAHQLRVK